LSRLLRARPRSEAEARDRLAQRGFPRVEIDEALDRAKASGLIDDRLFTRLWVRDRINSHPLSRKAIETELRALGVDTGLIQATLAAEYPAEDELAAAERLAAERFSRLCGRPADVRSRRTVDLLLRRGFSRSTAVNVVRQLEQETADE
jgi:SOS response regulatory protein OraA/RecX